MKISARDEFELSTGKRFYAVDYLLSIAADVDDDPNLYYGCDGTVHEFAAKDAKFTPSERREIADYMIANWNKWAVARLTA